jgi:Ca2+-binding EF-hand superfamily protein
MGKLQDFLSDQAQVDQISKDAFDKIDADKRGYLDESQIELVLNGITTQFSAPAPTKDQVQQAMAGKDKVSFAEFKTLLVEVLKIFAAQGH